MANSKHTMLLADVLLKIADTSVTNRTIFDALEQSLTINEIRSIIKHGIIKHQQITDNTNFIPSIHNSLLKNTEIAKLDLDINHTADHDGGDDWDTCELQPYQNTFAIKDLSIKIFQYLDIQSLSNCRSCN